MCKIIGICYNLNFVKTMCKETEQNTLNSLHGRVRDFTLLMVLPQDCPTFLSRAHITLAIRRRYGMRVCLYVSIYT